MSYRLARVWLTCATALFGALALFSVARAQDLAPVATTLSIAPLDPVVSGTPVKIQVTLATLAKEKSGAVDNESIDLSVDGVHARRAKTAAGGVVSFSLPGNLKPGKHLIKAEYAGSEELLPSSAATELVIVPAAREPKQAATGVPTALKIDPIDSLPVGRFATVVVRLSTPTGENRGAVGNELLQLFIDDQPVRRARTDSSGLVSFRTPASVPIGKHTLRVEYPGTRALLASSATSDLIVVPAQVDIQIVPPLAGIRFTLDQRQFVSGADGRARIEVTRAGTYRLEILPIESSQAEVRIEFSRWLDEVFTPHREVTVPLERPLQVGFNVYQRVSQRFIDLEGKPVDAGRISSVILKSSQGMAFKLTNNQARWMQASSVARRTTGLEETKIQYSVDTVIVDGSNVVNQSQQRFYVHPNDEWPIQLLLYSARFQARDGLFNTPLGSALHLEHPDGRVEQVPFGPNAEISIRSLVRGIYRVQVTGVPGISPLSPVALSRDQDVQLLVISYLDMAIGLVLASALGFGLLFVGRPKLFFMLGKPLVLVRAITGANRPIDGKGVSPDAREQRRGIGVYLAAIGAGLPIALARAGRFGGSSGRIWRHTAAQAAGTLHAAIVPGFTATLARLFNRYRGLERVVQYRPLQALRRRPNSIMAFALLVALLLIVGWMPGSGGANPQVTNAQPAHSVAGFPGTVVAATSVLPATSPAAGPPPTAAHAPTPQPTAQPTSPSPTPSVVRPPARSLRTSKTVLRFGRVLELKSTGDDVAQLQMRLRELEYFTYPTNTGYFGPFTFRAVLQFQTEHGLQATGIVDSHTIELLNSCGDDCAHHNRIGDGIQ